MARGFKVADAYIDVHVDDDTNAGRKKIEKDALKWSDLLGLKLGGRLGRGLFKGLSAVVSKTLSTALFLSKWLAIGTAIGIATQQLVGFVYVLGQAWPAMAMGIPTILGLVSVIGALKLAFSGLGDAIKAGASGDLAKYNEALKKLAPNAQAAVKQIIGMRAATDGLKRSIQQAFFAGFGGPHGVIATLANLYLPLIRKHLTGVAQDLNDLIKQLARVATGSGFLRDWTSTLANVRAGLRNIFQGLAPILQILRDIGTVAAPLFATLTAGFGGWAQHLASVVDRLRASGQLTSMIQNAVSILGGLFRMVVSVGSSIISIFRIISQAGGGQAFSAFGMLIKQFADFLKTAAGARTLTVVFEAIHQAAVALGPALGGVFIALGAVLRAIAPFLPVLANVIAQVINTLGPLLGPIAQLLVAGLQELAPVVTAIAQAVATLVPAIAPLIPYLGKFVAAIVEALLPALIPALQTVLPVLTQLIQIIGDALLPILPPVADLLGVVASVIQSLAMPIGALIKVLGPVVVLIARSLSAALQKILPRLIPLINLLAGALEPIITALGPVIEQLAGSIADILVTALDNLIPFLAEMLPLFADMITTLLPTLIPLIQQLAVTFQEVLPALIPLLALIIKLANLWLPLLPPILEAVIGAMTIWLKLFNASIAPIMSFVQIVATLLGNLIDLRGMFHFFQDGWNTFLYLAKKVWGAISNQINDYITGVKTRFQTFIGFFKNLLPNIKGALTGAASALIGIGKDIVFGLWNGISSMGGWLKNQIVGWVADHIPAPIAHFLQIGSPSKLMKELFKWVPVGAAQGIDAGRGLVASAASRLASAAVPSFGAAPAFAMATGANGTGGRGQGATMGPYHLTLDGKAVAQFVIDAVTGAPRQVAANISSAVDNGSASSYKTRG